VRTARGARRAPALAKRGHAGIAARSESAPLHRAAAPRVAHATIAIVITLRAISASARGGGQAPPRHREEVGTAASFRT